MPRSPPAGKLRRRRDVDPRYSSIARQDYLEIAAYIARDNPVAAADTVDRIEAKCQLVAAQPERGDRHDELPESLFVYRVGSYLIVYRIEDEGVLILRIVHGARDLRRLFPEQR